MENFINLQFITGYLVIGAIVALIIDISIHMTKSSEPFTFSEIWAMILVWPFVILRVLRDLFNS
jgi:hypothetical protein